MCRVWSHERARRPVPPCLSARGRMRPIQQGLHLTAGGMSDVGRVREHNEDYFLLRPELGLFLVADGMGGHGSGEIASRITAFSVRDYFEVTLAGGELDEVPKPHDTLPMDGRRLVGAIRKANRDVVQISRTHIKHRGMGSTVVAIATGEDATLFIGHVGDSRCYRLRGGGLDQLTRDHSLINEALALKPDMSPKDLAQFPKNIVTRGIGMSPEVVVDIRVEKPEPGDLYLLCSDGLSGLVKEDLLLALLLDAEPQEAAQRLVEEANSLGGTDNISAIVIRIDGVMHSSAKEEPPPPSEEVPMIESQQLLGFTSRWGRMR